MIGRVIKILKDFLFPIFCLGCGCEGVLFCKQCKRRTKVRPFVFYPLIKELSLGILAFFPYVQSSVWGGLISSWKYRFVQEISLEWKFLFSQERLCLSKYLSIFDKSRPIYLVPVPLHSRRERERGFNQAKVLVVILERQLSEQGFKVQVLDCLKRIRYTSQQAKLDPSAREKNLRGAFVFEHKNIIPEQVILVDDVFTTGFTAGECARALQSAGAKKTGMIVLAHG